MTPRVRRPGLIVVANRLPVARVRSRGGVRWERSPGGLVSALAPFLETTGGGWVGWPGFAGAVPAPFTSEGLELHPVELSKADVERFYAGFSNGTLWPLYHDAVRWPDFDRDWWQSYVDVNRRFARAAAELARDGRAVWVHDYQLQLVPGMIREEVPDARIGFFLHIPFPPVELFAQLPWRRQILEGLLGADVVGFQTRLGAANFLRAAQRYTRAQTFGTSLAIDGREVRVGSFPISIDVARYAEIAADEKTQERARELRSQVGENRKILLGVDRLDYTKGIDRRLAAFEDLLERYEEALDEATFVQVAVPSREAVPDYASMRERIEQQVGRINGSYGEPLRTPVHYHYRNLPLDELVAWYVAADVMVVTPLRDGMNLVAKEYVTTRADDDGVLILSEFAGAAHEMPQALLVNPYDVEGLADAYEQAISMSPDEQRRRMGALRRTVQEHDVHAWARSFVQALEGS
jgi:trehalose 6-phosphate synthase